MIYSALDVAVPATPYVVIVISALIGCLSALSVLALHDADSDTWLVRAYQRLRLARVRLPRMLENRQVDVGAYVRTVPVVVLKRQIAACSACTSKAACDRALVCREADAARLEFCPNLAPIEHFKRTMGAAVVPLVQA